MNDFKGIYIGIIIVLSLCFLLYSKELSGYWNISVMVLIIFNSWFGFKQIKEQKK